MSRHHAPYVLIVEDDPANIFVGTTLLEVYGYRCDAVQNGVDAVAKILANRDHYCAVLMDVHLPGLNGLDAVRMIRQHEQENGHSRLPIIAVTASVFPKDKEVCFEAGMDAFLAKPYQPQELIAILQSLTNCSGELRA